MQLLQRAQALCCPGAESTRQASVRADLVAAPMPAAGSKDITFRVIQRDVSRMSDSSAVTTLALRGISKTYSIRAVQHFLDAACGDFGNKRYNFLYLPRRGHSHSGLAIVNFIDAPSCAACELHFRQLQRHGGLSGIKSIGKSYIQGFAQNLAYFAALRPSGAGDTADASHVLVLENGQPADINRMIRRYVTPALVSWAAGQAEVLYHSEKGKDKTSNTGESSEDRSNSDDQKSRNSTSQAEVVPARRGSDTLGLQSESEGAIHRRLPTKQEAEQIRRHFRLPPNSKEEFLIFSL